MSHKLHIGSTDKRGFDCVIDRAEGAAEKLRAEWLKGGPYKISIGDIGLFRELEPVLKKVLSYVWTIYPEDIRSFWINGDYVAQPTHQELDEFIEKHGA